MSPPRSARGRKPSATEGTTTDTTDTAAATAPTWDTSQATLPAFVHALQEYLPTVDSRYKSLVRDGSIIAGKYTLGVSLNHIDRLCVKGSIPKGTFAAPAQIKPADLIASSLGFPHFLNMAGELG